MLSKNIVNRCYGNKITKLQNSHIYTNNIAAINNSGLSKKNQIEIFLLKK
ncbi:hypothetical protein JBKA6_1252 [Ichthyobacterium seriolicida]|uniref:Uncharacterized protein n=1 Tax=Ichthyobacterium seriolicida TaxID=242600 RepID=A0A1J1DZE9_9FLAO|nr:hypothetical protein JBKA6_1252 [Ichthyobacterium seriolicida]